MELVVEDMISAVDLLSEKLLLTDILTSNPTVTRQLINTLKVFLQSLIKIAKLICQ